MKERQPIKTAFLPTNDADDISSSSLQEDIEDMAKANVASRRGRKSHLERSICTLGASLDLPSPPPCTLTKGSFSRKPTRRIAPNLPMMVVPVSVEESFYFNMDQLKAFTQDQPRSTLAMEESSPLADQFGFLNFSSPTSRPATSPSALSMGSNGMFLDELERQREEMENQLMGESSDGGPTHPDLDQYFALPSISSTDGQLSLYDDIFVGI